MKNQQSSNQNMQSVFYRHYVFNLCIDLVNKLILIVEPHYNEKDILEPIIEYFANIDRENSQTNKTSEALNSVLKLSLQFLNSKKSLLTPDVYNKIYYIVKPVFDQLNLVEEFKDNPIKKNQFFNDIESRIINTELPDKTIKLLNNTENLTIINTLKELKNIYLPFTDQLNESEKDHIANIFNINNKDIVGNFTIFKEKFRPNVLNAKQSLDHNTSTRAFKEFIECAVALIGNTDRVKQQTEQPIRENNNKLKEIERYKKIQKDLEESQEKFPKDEKKLDKQIEKKLTEINKKISQNTNTVKAEEHVAEFNQKRSTFLAKLNATYNATYIEVQFDESFKQKTIKDLKALNQNLEKQYNEVKTILANYRKEEKQLIDSLNKLQKDKGDIKWQIKDDKKLPNKQDPIKNQQDKKFMLIDDQWQVEEEKQQSDNIARQPQDVIELEKSPKSHNKEEEEEKAVDNNIISEQPEYIQQFGDVVKNPNFKYQNENEFDYQATQKQFAKNPQDHSQDYNSDDDYQYIDKIVPEYLGQIYKQD